MVANVIASCSSVGSTLFSVITQLLTTLRFVFTVSDGFFFALLLSVTTDGQMWKQHYDVCANARIDIAFSNVCNVIVGIV